MRFMPTRVHGVLDYIIGIVLIAAPFLFDFWNGGQAEGLVPVLIGAAIIIYSLFTDYELGAMRKLSMPAHLWMDGIGGAILAISPWLFGFADVVFWPHLIIGLLDIAAALVTHVVPDDRAAIYGRATPA